MNETDVGQILTGDWEAEFPRHYERKTFLADAARLRDLARLRIRQSLTEAEQAEVTELRKRIRRADADAVMLLVIEARTRGGLIFF
jgi:hypothetical protein